MSGDDDVQQEHGCVGGRAGFQRGAWDPGFQEIIKTHRKSLLELPVLTFQEELLYGFPVNKNTFLFIRIISCTF
jgi:hypothetical protein